MHYTDDSDCETNSYYFEKLKGWADDTTGVKLGCGEYYNLSRYEDLPLIFTKIPAEVHGLNKGILKAGYDADIVVFDENINIEKVFAAK